MSEERKSSVERIQRLLDAKMTNEERDQRLAALTDEEREQLQALAWLKERTGQALGGVNAPSGLEDRLRESLQDVVREGDTGERRPLPSDPSPSTDTNLNPTRPRPWGVISAAVAALLLIAALVVWKLAGGESSPNHPTQIVEGASGAQSPLPGSAEELVASPEDPNGAHGPEAGSTDPPAFAALVEAVAVDVEAYRDGQFTLEFASQDSAAIQDYFAENGIPFHTRVFDLAMMEYQLTGGKTHSLDGKTSAAFAYHGPNGIRMLCQMYEGTIEDLPEADDVREQNGIQFYSFQRGGVAMTFWREGDVICVLASMADLDEVVALAIAKAEKV